MKVNQFIKKSQQRQPGNPGFLYDSFLFILPFKINCAPMSPSPKKFLICTLFISIQPLYLPKPFLSYKPPLSICSLQRPLKKAIDRVVKG